MDQPFDTPTTGQADWDSGLYANFQALERGYHVTERAGVAINTGEVVTLTDSGFFFPYDASSAGAFAHGVSYMHVASGETLTALAWGIVRSLTVFSGFVAGRTLFGSSSTPGLIVTSDANEDRPLGIGLDGNGVLFLPVRSALSAGGGVTQLGSLSDVNRAGLADGKILKWSDSGSKFIMANDAGGVTMIRSLSDIDFSGLSSGDILQWSNTASNFLVVPVPGGGGGGGASNLNSLDDVDATGLMQNKMLLWSDTESKYVLDDGTIQTYWPFIVPIIFGLGVVTTTSIEMALTTGGGATPFSLSWGNGQAGWNRRVRLSADSAQLVELKIYRDAGLTDLQYQTFSGGVNAFSGFMDRAGFPVDLSTADFTTFQVYGTIQAIDRNSNVTFIAEWEN